MEPFETQNQKILNLPPEILLNIFKFIDVRQLYQTVILTCKFFHNVLTSDGIWKTLFALKWEEHSMIDDLLFINSWCDIYISYEDIDNFWKNTKADITSTLLCGHYGIVDSVHILPSKDIFVSGSRDRNLFVWKEVVTTTNNFNSNKVEPIVLKGHQGWIWAIETDKTKENEIVTVSWDKTVKTWDLNRSECVKTYKYHPAAILAISCNNEIYTTGCYDKKMRRYDVRSKKIVQSSALHKGPLLALQMTDNYIFTGSEDQSIGIFDIRANKILTKLRVDTPVLTMNFATDHGLNYLRVGGKDGNMFLFDVTSQHFTLLNSFQLWTDGNKVTKLCNFKGCLLACSQSGSIRAFTPDRQCTLIQTLEDAHSGGVTSCHARGDVCITGGSDNSAKLWKFNKI